MKYALIVLLCAASLAGGYLLGYRAATDHGDARPADAPVARHVDLEAQTEAAITTGSLRASSTETDALKTQVESMSLADTSAMLSRIRNMPDSEGRRGLLIDYFRRFGQLDPEAAIAATEDFPTTDRLSFMTSAIVGWARVDREAAWSRFLFETRDGALDSLNPWAVINEIAKTDLADAIAKSQQLKGDRATQQAISGVMQAMEKSGRYAESWKLLAQIKSPYIRENKLRGLFSRWSATAPDAAMQAIQTIDDQSARTSAMVGYIRAWAQNDTLAALDFVAKNIGDPAASESAPDLGRRLVKTLPGDELLEVLSSIEDPIAQQKIVSSIYRDLVTIDPEVTIAMVSKIPDARQRDFETRNIIRKWTEFDAPAALEYVATIPDDQTKSRAIDGLLDPRSLRKGILDNGKGGSRYLDIAGTISDEQLRMSQIYRYASVSGFIRSEGQSDVADRMIADIEGLAWLTDEQKRSMREIAQRERPAGINRTILRAPATP